MFVQLILFRPGTPAFATPRYNAIARLGTNGRSYLRVELPDGAKFVETEQEEFVLTANDRKWFAQDVLALAQAKAAGCRFLE